MYAVAFANDNCKKQILLVNSHDINEPFRKNLIDQLTAELLKNGYLPIIHCEDLNAAKITSQKALDQKKNFFFKKYKQLHPDLILFLFNSGFQLLQKEVFEKWGDIPSVLYAETQFIGIDNESFFKKTFLDVNKERCLSEFNVRKNLTIVYNRVHIYETLTMMNKMMPSLEAVGLIYDKNWNGIQNAKRFLDNMQQYFPNIRPHLFSSKEMSTAEMLDSVNHMPEQSALIYNSWEMTDKDKLSSYYDPHVHKMISGLVKLPIFTFYDHGVKEGYLAGGVFPFSHTIISTLSDISLRKLLPDRYQKPENSIHVMGYPVLNYRYITTKKIPVDGLVVDPVYYERPKDFVKENWVEIILGGLGVSMLFIAGLARIIYLRRSRYRQRKELERTKKIMKELEIAKDKAEESERMKTAFLANISHEVRTPLNSIVGFSDLLASVDLNAEEKAEFVKTIRLNNDLLLRLIDDILSLSDLESNNHEFVFNSFDLYPVMEVIKDEFRFRMRENLFLIFDEHSPQCQILSDKNRLIQVIINLVSNAIKFTSQGTITYGYTLCNNGNSVEFYVKDEGKGIASDQLERIFERFYKVDTFTQGSGLGLTISANIVKKLGGKISVESEEGVGTTFRLNIPITR